LETRAALAAVVAEYRSEPAASASADANAAAQSPRPRAPSHE
jgi:hypothetical protein